MVCFWELVKGRGVPEECPCKYRVACGASSHVLSLGSGRQGIVKETVNLLDSSPSIQKQLLGYGMTLEVPK